MEDQETTDVDCAEEKHEVPLESWKEIANYLQRDVRTAVRWEKSEGLPVRRHMHRARPSVYAFPSELDAWRIHRAPGMEKFAKQQEVLSRLLRVTCGAVFLLLTLFSTGNGGRAHSSEGKPPAKGAAGIQTREIWTNAMGGMHGSPSPDGKYLSFLDWNTGNLAVWDIENETQRLVTEDGSWDDPRQMAEGSIWSPDQQYLAYSWYVVRENRREVNELRIVGIEDPNPRVLLGEKTTDWIQPLDWSPDGENILLALNRRFGESRLALISVKDGTLNALKTATDPFEIGSFSPDGRYIAFSIPQSLDSPNEDLFLLSLDSKADTRLVEHPANDSLLGWIPDKEWVLFASDRTGSRGLWAVQVVDGIPAGKPLLLKRDFARTCSLGMSQDGSFYYSEVKVARDISSMEIDPETGRVLREAQKAVVTYEGSNQFPSYSPDGKYLAYISKRAGMFFPTLYGNALCVKSLESGEERVLLEELRREGIRWAAAPRWYPDNQAIVIVGWADRVGFYRIDLVDRSIRRVVEFPEDVVPRAHELGPDGDTLFYSFRDKENGAVVRRQLSTGEELELVSFSASISVSPDGQWLAFSYADEKVKTLQVLPSSGGQARILHQFEPRGYSVSHAWSPDGKYIYFTGLDKVGNERALCRVSVEGGEAKELTPKMLGLTSITVHPDGRHIAFHTASEIDTAADVWVMKDYLPE